MVCANCGLEYEHIYAMGTLKPVSSIPRCTCSTFMTYNSSTSLPEFTPKITTRCDGCGDIIPTKMIIEVGSDLLCPECYNIVEPIPDPSETIADLVDLERELRDGT